MVATDHEGWESPGIKSLHSSIRIRDQRFDSKTIIDATMYILCKFPCVNFHKTYIHKFATQFTQSLPTFVMISQCCSWQTNVIIFFCLFFIPIINLSENRDASKNLFFFPPLPIM